MLFWAMVDFAVIALNSGTAIALLARVPSPSHRYRCWLSSYLPEILTGLVSSSKDNLFPLHALKPDFPDRMIRLRYTKSCCDPLRRGLPSYEVSVNFVSPFFLLRLFLIEEKIRYIA